MGDEIADALRGRRLERNLAAAPIGEARRRGALGASVLRAVGNDREQERGKEAKTHGYGPLARWRDFPNAIIAPKGISESGCGPGNSGATRPGYKESVSG